MRHAADLLAYALSLPHLTIELYQDFRLGFYVQTADGQGLSVGFGRSHYADDRWNDCRTGLASKTVELSGWGQPWGEPDGEPAGWVPVADAADVLRRLNDHGANIAFHR